MKVAPSPVKAFALAQGIAVAQPRGLRLDGQVRRRRHCGGARRSRRRRARRDRRRRLRPDPAALAAGAAAPRLPQHPCLAAAALARRGADPAGHRGGRRRHRRHHHADGRRPRHRRDADRRDAGDRRCRQPRTRCTLAPGRVLGGELAVQALGALAKAEPARSAAARQAGVTYAAKITKAEAPIDWRAPAAAIERRLRAFDPAPGARACWPARRSPAGAASSARAAAGRARSSRPRQERSSLPAARIAWRSPSCSARAAGAWPRKRCCAAGRRPQAPPSSRRPIPGADHEGRLNFAAPSPSSSLTPSTRRT